MPLFKGVLYHISESLAECQRREIARIIDANGATEVALDLATHIISDTVEFQGCDSLREGVACVTPYWAERSMELGQLQDPKCFSADKAQLFSGVVATSADILPGDKEVIAAGIMELGGAWREGLTRDVTHLFVTNTRSEKYRTAMHFRHIMNITVLLPHWFDQCWSTQIRLPPDVFMFPDPPYMKKDHDSAAYKAQMFIKADDSTDKRAVFRTLQPTDFTSAPAQPARDIWHGLAILLSSSLALDAQRRESVETRIRRAGGKVVVAQDEESAVVAQADIFVTRFRAGPAYAKALTDGKTIGTLAWLFYVERVGIVTRPRDQLLHYPIRNRPIEGFADHEITVTNYQGDARQYLKKLIEAMGATFTSTMSGRNTIVIAAYKGGNKTAKADEWSVPVVTHTWLEDCFIEWRNLTPAQKKYVDYAPGVNYGTVLGERGVGRVGLEEDPELPPINRKENAREKEATAVQGGGETKKAKDGEGFTATGTSARDAHEVEVENVLGLAGDIEHDAVCTPGKVGPPRGFKMKPPAENAAAVTAKPVSKPKSNSKPDDGQAEQVVDEHDDDHDAPRQEKKTSKKAVPAPEESDVSDDNVRGRDTSGKVARSRADDQAEASGCVSTGPIATAKPKPRPNLRSGERPLSDSNEESGKAQARPEKLKAKPVTQSDEKNVAGGTSKTMQMTAKLKPRLRSTSENDTGSAEEERPHGTAVLKRQKAENSRADEKTEEAEEAEAGKEAEAAEAAEAAEEAEEADDEEEEPPCVKSKASPKSYRSKAKVWREAVVAAFESENESDDNDVHQVVSKKGTTSGKASAVVNKNKSKAPVQRLIPSPNRIVSVDLPDPRSLLTSIPANFRLRTHNNHGSAPKRASSPAQVSPGKLSRFSSLRAAAYETPVPSPKRGRPSLKHDPRSCSTTPSSLFSPPRHPQNDDPSTTARAASDTSGASSPPPLRLQRKPSRRSAAAAATQKLRDEVMPDVMTYQKELKRDAREKGGSGRRRKNSQSKAGHYEDDTEDDESEGQLRGQKRQKVIKDEGASGTGKKAAMRHDTDDSDGPQEQFTPHIKTGKRPATEDNPGPNKRANGSGARKEFRIESSEPEDGSDDEADLTRSSCKPNKIGILTTKIEVSPEVTDALSRLGVKFVEKPADCTHLVANSFARTEKFLCALSNAPFVLSRDWLLACVEAEKVVAEKAYFLKDPDTEHKHKFKLVDALTRAEELKKKKQKLLAGHFFYFTANVPIDFQLMKNVLQTNGAECRRSTPTIRNLSDTRHVISCLKDEKIWRPLAKQGAPIYSCEFVLMAALAQHVDWEGDDKRVPGG